MTAAPDSTLRQASPYRPAPGVPPPARAGDPLDAVDTPALLVDLDALERNLARMREAAAAAGVALRPHAKTHKCAAIARMQMAAGAVGVAAVFDPTAISFNRAMVQIAGNGLRISASDLRDGMEDSPSLRSGLYRNLQMILAQSSQTAACNSRHTLPERCARWLLMAHDRVEGDELLLITQQGMILRMQTNDVRAIGRATQGVRLIDIEGDDLVVSIARLVEKEDEEPNT